MTAHKFDTMTGGDGNGPVNPLLLLAVFLGIYLLSMGVT